MAGLRNPDALATLFDLCLEKTFSNIYHSFLLSGFNALRELQRKQEQELNDDTNPSSIEIRRRIVQLVHEMARDGVI